MTLLFVNSAVFAQSELQPSPLDIGEAIKVMIGLFMVLGVIGVSAWLIRRTLRLSTTTNGCIKVLAGLPMGARERIVLLEVGETQLLVGVAPGRIQTLHVLENPVPVDRQGAQPVRKFASELRSLVNARRGATHE